MKRFIIYGAIPLLAASCGGDGDFDATGTFEATEIVVSAEAAGRILRFDAEEGDVLRAGRQVGAIDTVQLYLQKLQLERQRASVRSGRPDIGKQAASLREQIAKQQTERRRVENLLKDGAATTKQLDDIDAQLKVLGGQLDALLSTLENNAVSIDENSSAIELQIAQVEDRLAKCRIASPVTGTVLAKYAEAGELASVGRPLMKVADLDRIYLRAYFTSDQLADLRLGQEVTVTADFGGERQLDYPGRIVWIASERIHSQNRSDPKFAGRTGLCGEDRRRERRPVEDRPLRRGETLSATTMRNAIEIHALTKRYGILTALDEVSFEVGRGELFGLIGPDGAGKTTLFRLLATLVAPDGGTASVDGLDIVADYKRIRERVGYMPGRFSLYPDLSVGENLAFFAALFGVEIAENYDLVAPIYRQIEPFRARRAGKLSGGMKQKLALCCALIHRPAVLLLDEPTTGVDAVSRSEFWDMLSELKGKGISMLVSTPYMDEAVRCDRVALCDGGKILAVDTPQGVVGRFDEPLYALAGDDMYGLLLEARRHADVKECYPFGQTHHLIAGEGFDAGRFVRETTARGFRRVTLRPVGAGIEDVFIKLMRHA